MKIIIKVILSLIVLAIVGYFCYDYYLKTTELNRVNQANSNVTKKIKAEAKEIKRKVDENGIETVLFNVTNNKGTVSELLATKDTKDVIDTTAMALDIRTKQLKQILIVKATLETENLKLKKQLDAAKRPFYTFSGNGLDLKFTPPNDLDTAARATFKANVGIIASQYWRRDWFLGSKKSILAVRSQNPEIFKVNGADFIEIEQKQPAFGLRIQANASYNMETGQLGYGPAARFDVGRFSFQGRYSKFPNDPKWKPMVNASYDLLRF
jgi:hypothetical protein